jgi:hypothetical protein
MPFFFATKYTYIFTECIIPLWCSMVHSAHQDSLLSLSVLDSVISSSDTDERIVTAMDELQDSV